MNYTSFLSYVWLFYCEILLKSKFECKSKKNVKLYVRQLIPCLFFVYLFSSLNVKFVQVFTDVTNLTFLLKNNKLK